MPRMTNEADSLIRAGFTVRALSASELDLERGDERVRAHLIRQSTGPSRRQIEQTRLLTPGEVTLFVAPRATARVQALVAQEPRAWLLTHDGTAMLGDDHEVASHVRRSPRGRVPWGRWALIRALVRSAEPRTQVELAREVGLTQGAVSGALTKLSAAVRNGSGWSATDRRELWDAFLTEYPGAGGVRTYWYSRLPFVRQTELLRTHTILSADAGSDIIAPWRTPVRAVAYASGSIDMEALGFSRATADEATVDLVIPTDRTVFATAEAWGYGVADPLLIAWDMSDVGGNDAEEAIAHLRSTILGKSGR